MRRCAGRGSRFWLSLSAFGLSAAYGALEPPVPEDSCGVVSQAIVRTQSDIERAVGTLNALRDRIAAERRPLATRLETLRREVAELREQLRETRRAGLSGEAVVRSLGDETEALERKVDGIRSSLLEYRRSLETRLGPAEQAALAPDLEAFDMMPVESNGLVRAADRLLALADRLAARRLGGYTFEGDALDGKGLVHSGHFVVVGPATWFCADDGTVGGLAVIRPGRLTAGVYAPPGVDAGVLNAAVRRLTEGKEADVPVDVTGDARKLAEAVPSFSEHLRQGGPVMIPLLAVGIWALVLIVLKTFELARIPLPPPGGIRELEEALKRNDPDAARATAARTGEPLASILLEAVDHRDAPAEEMEEILEDRVLATLPSLERHLGTLAVLGGIAPLLGLLGTVTGMIHTFRLVAVFGTGEAGRLSAGISEALVTTEAGLVIAIPILLAHAFLMRRVRTLIAAYEQTVARLVHAIHDR